MRVCYQLVVYLSFVIGLSCQACFAASEPSLLEKKYTVYSFGVVPQFEQRKSFHIWQPILIELEKRTGFKFALKGSSKIPDFEDSFMVGDFDIAYMNPYHIVSASNIQGYVPLVRDGGRTLNGVLVVRRDSGIENISELEGKTIAFPSPNALGASLLIRAELKKQFDIKFNAKYVQTHSSVYYHVFKKLVDAGGGVVQTLESQKAPINSQLKILYKTASMSPHPIAAHPRVPIEHQIRIKEALLSLESEENGRYLLAKVPIKRMISASMTDYQNIMGWGLGQFYIP